MRETLHKVARPLLVVLSFLLTTLSGSADQGFMDFENLRAGDRNFSFAGARATATPWGSPGNGTAVLELANDVYPYRPYIHGTPPRFDPIRSVTFELIGDYHDATCRIVASPYWWDIDESTGTIARYTGSTDLRIVVPARSTVTVTIPGEVRTLRMVPLSGNDRFTIDNFAYEYGAATDVDIRFDLDSASYPDGVKMLVAKHRTDDTYPHTEQLDPDSQGRPRMRIAGWVSNRATGLPPTTPTTVYLRLRDPEDTAPYVVQAGHHHLGDNEDKSARLSTVNGSASAGAFDCQGTGCAPGTIAVTADAGVGRFEAILTGTTHVAGDNYRIEASVHQTMPAPASTAVITAWKRVYVEINKMARKGSLLTDDLTVGDREIPVADVRHFPNEPFKILLLHAPRANSTGGQFYTEEHTVERIEGKKWYSWGKPEPGKLFLKAGETVRRPFLGPERVRNRTTGIVTERAYLADGAIWLRNNREKDYFTPDLSLAAKLFENAFVEPVWLTDDAPADGAPASASTLQHDGYVPYFESIEGDNVREWVARKWMRNASRSGTDRSAHDNHQVLFTASHMVGRKGVTKVGNGFNDMWTFANNFGDANGGKVLSHEMSHQWRVNQGHSPVLGRPTPTTRGHCDRNFNPQPTDPPVPAYTGTDACLMNHDIGIIADGLNDHVLFHYIVSGQAVDSEYIWVRERTEPVPQSEEMDRILQ